MVLLPIWGRKAITNICLKNWARLKESENIDVLCVVSEQWAKIEAVKHGFKYVEVSNDDLGNKMNVGVQYALKFKWDYLMNMGSDDLVSERMFRLYEQYTIKERPMFGLTKLVFFDSKEKSAKSVNYGCMIGAGRCIRRDVLKRHAMTGDKVTMYDEGIDRCLDNNSRKRFFTVSMDEIQNDPELLIDIKGDENIWSYDFLDGEKVELKDLNLEDEYLTDLIEL
jgi:hypothetical protein